MYKQINNYSSIFININIHIYISHFIFGYRMSQKDIYEVNYLNSTSLSPIEAQILTQYQLLAKQLNTLSSEIENLNSSESIANENDVESSAGASNADKLLDNLRNLEMKMGLVYTLFKGAVYSLFLQHEEDLNLKNDIEQQREEEEEQEEGDKYENVSHGDRRDRGGQDN